ncbi:Lrp/AsnC family transcriptional regulator [Halococcoides cellulosivorans]|uniref:AsnC family transcriptional regulator n=1 Tax=Halococcoides cellulosivorans TaxID=1679096 RepID=A0A2R4WZE7_9EURY|nr:Lrp/AsnC family transcriptional regulator [Halococcoides cellulosivorans]AWB26907.1 AsnC family transcriptional regulator [Halococcoides cellulosivorans]
MDEVDREIISILREDARTPYTEIGERVGISEGTVRNRVDRLLEDGVIERFTVATRTGNVKAMIELVVGIDVDTDACCDRLADWGEVDTVWQVSGESDIVLVVDCLDTDGVNDLITRARELEAVQSTKTRLILEERIG